MPLRDRFRYNSPHFEFAALASLEELYKATLGAPTIMTWDEIAKHWKQDCKAIETWLRLDDETRAKTDAPWRWWCLDGRDQANLLCCFRVNHILGVKVKRSDGESRLPLWS